MAKVEPPSSIAAMTLNVEPIKVWKRARSLAAADLYDEATGLYNGSHLATVFTQEQARDTRHDHPLSAIKIVVHGSRDVRERHGEGTAISALRDMGRIICRRLRNYDLVFRAPDEGIVVLLPETGLQGGRTVCESLVRKFARTSLAGLPPGAVAADIGLTSVMGVSEDSLETVLARLSAEVAKAADQGGGISVAPPD